MTEREIFVAAIYQPGLAARQAFLDGACGGDADARGRVEALLVEHDRLGSFLERPAIVPQDTGVHERAAEPAVIPDASEAAGCMIGPYKLLEVIGEGGMGSVWMANQSEPIRRRVAVKVVKAGMDSKQVLARFEAERQALALMDHPNIARVLDAGTTPMGRPYFVMELVKGLPLTRYCDERQLSVSDRLRVFQQICHAIQHAHQKGVIHRDLKPTNILVESHDGRPVPKVIDFGLAKAVGAASLSDRSYFTQFGAVLGTPLYMAPEQADFGALDIDTRVDVFALGILLYELLTGTTPLEKKRLAAAAWEEIRQVIKEEEPQTPSARLSTSEGKASVAALRQTEPAKLGRFVRGELDWVVMKALAKQRDRRYESAGAFAADVERFLNQEPVLAGPPTATYQLQKFVRRNYAAVVTTCLIAALLLVGTVISTWLAIRAVAAEGLARQRLEAESKALNAAESAGQQAALERDLAQRRQYDARLAEAQASRWSGQAGRRFGGLKALQEATQLARDLDLGPAETLKLRNEAIACLALVDLRPDQKWSGYPSGSTTTGIAFDREMQRYARVDENGHISVRSLANNEEICRLTDTGAPAGDFRMFLIFSPDGQFLAAGGEAHTAVVPLQVWDLKGRRSLLKTAPAGGFEQSVDFSPDGRTLAARGADGSSIALYDFLTTGEPHRFSVGKPIRTLRFHPHGDRLAVCSGSNVLVLDRSGREVCSPLAHPQRALRVAWNATGQLLASACADGQAYVWDMATGMQQTICKGHQKSVINVAFSHRGGLLATSGEDETTRLWDARSGKELLITNGLAAEFANDDRWLGLGVYGHNVGRWEVALGREFRSLHGHAQRAQIRSLDASPDGRWLVSTASDGVRLWDAVNGNLIGILPCGTTYAAIIDRAGQFLITSGHSGLLRWPLRTAAIGLADRVQVGPPEPVHFPSGTRTDVASLSANGRTLAVHQSGTAAVVALELDQPTKAPRNMSPAFEAAVSPDAKWVATNIYDFEGGKVWEAETGAWVRDFPGVKTAHPAFSPDNRWLVFATAAHFRFYRVSSWEPGPQVRRDYAGYTPGPLAFTRDGKMAAIGYSARTIQLIECESGREIATLAAPAPELLESLCFTPDGSRLVAGTYNGVIQMWDLRRIREQLRELGVDWDPALDTASQTQDSRSIEFEVDAGDLLDPRKRSEVQSYRNFGTALRQQGKLLQGAADRLIELNRDLDKPGKNDKGPAKPASDPPKSSPDSPPVNP